MLGSESSIPGIVGSRTFDGAKVIDCGLARGFVSELEAIQRIRQRSAQIWEQTTGHLPHKKMATSVDKQSKFENFSRATTGPVMRARRILQTGAFSPDDVIRLQEAFDAAWETVAPTVETVDQPHFREILATIVVSAGNVSGLDAEELAAVAVRTFEAIRASTPL